LKKRREVSSFHSKVQESSKLFSAFASSNPVSDEEKMKKFEDVWSEEYENKRIIERKVK
jgi:hypothetical protein